MGTDWAGHDVKAQDKYQRGRQAAEEAVTKDRLRDGASEVSTAMSTAREL